MTSAEITKMYEVIKDELLVKSIYYSIIGISNDNLNKYLTLCMNYTSSENDTEFILLILREFRDISPDFKMYYRKIIIEEILTY